MINSDPADAMGRSLGNVQVRRLGLVPYVEAWQLQSALADGLVDGTAEDTLLLLEHPSVYTAGRRTEDWERPHDGTPVVDVDRGGKITWHGPGQLVGYPVVRLPDPIDVVGHVRRLEAGLISACERFGLATVRVTGRSGVWTADGARKIAAIGIRVRRGVAFHGFALNCDADLSAFDRIVPCGITDAGVTSLSRELGRQITVDDVLPVVEEEMIAVLTGTVPTAVPTADPTPRRLVIGAHG
jgi:lipoyl(octanoyl) transferase